MKINRRNFVKATLAGVAGGIVSPSTKASELDNSKANKKPNIIFIMADDLGYGDVSCFGRPDYETPVIDGLARDGVMLPNTYANSAVCSPTRTALLTGQYQYRFRAGLEEPIGNDNYGLPENQETIASQFRQQGYETALVGKWHIGSPPDFGPLKSGYDHFFGFYPGGLDYFSHHAAHGKVELFKDRKNDGLWRDGKEPIKIDGYLTDVLGDEAQVYLEQFAKTDDPFFLSLHFSAPHWPWEGPNDINRSRDLTTIIDLEGGNAAIYGEMVKSMDANIGRVLRKLKELGMEEDTIIVFTSDNGGERFSYNWPFLGKKGELLEGGIRVPGIVRWPNRIKAGSINEQVITSMDWMPTLLAAANSTSSDAIKTDGENLIEVLLDRQQPINRQLFWRFKASEQKAALDGHWKYLKLKEKEYLFDIHTDQREQANLKTIHPEIFEKLKTDYEEWNKTMLPYPEGSYSHKIDSIYTDRY